MLLILLSIVSFLLPPTNHASPITNNPYPFSVEGKYIKDNNNNNKQFRCVNWPMHMESNLPEGLSNNSISNILNNVVDSQGANFNCLRINYSVEVVTDPTVQNMTVRESLENNNHDIEFDLSKFVTGVEQHNPDLIDGPILSPLKQIITESATRGIFILMDNTVSVSSWCCSFVDGNGWPGDDFDVDLWMSSLENMARELISFDNVVAYSLRNELRYDESTRPKNRSQLIEEWMEFTPKAIKTINQANPDALIFVGGMDYENDWSFLNADSGFPIGDAWGNIVDELADKIVFEGHIYDWSGFGEIAKDCESFLAGVDAKLNWPIVNGKAFVLTELGNDLDSFDIASDEPINWYYDCVGQWVVEHELGYMWWVLGGSYYVRDDFAQSPSYEWFGLLNIEWDEWHNVGILQESIKYIWTE